MVENTKKLTFLDIFEVNDPFDNYTNQRIQMTLCPTLNKLICDLEKKIMKKIVKPPKRMSL